MALRNSKIDIHNYDKNYEYTKNYLKRVDMPERSRQLILDFERACFLKESLSKPRLIRIMQALGIIARKYASDDFDRMDKRAVEDMVMKIENIKTYSVWTKQSYKSIIKKFFKWLNQGDDYTKIGEYPPIVSWINTNVKKKDKPRVNASDLLTEDEVRRILEAAQHPRDKAFISMLYELGARIGEIGGLRIKDVTKDNYGYIVDLSGKTGHRTPRIVLSDSYLTGWLNMHPLKDNPEAPLWIIIGNSNRGKHMSYDTFKTLVMRLQKRAGVKKRMYHHLFRHTRVTHLLLNDKINEAKAKVYFGWVPDSKMLSEYSHLMSSDVNNSILEIYDIKTEENKKPILKPKQCPRCQIINGVDSQFCYKCGCILDVNTAIDLDEERRKSDDLMVKLMKDSDVQKLLAKKIIDLGLKDELLKGST